MHKNQILKGRNATYARIVCTIRPEKSETHRTRITIGGNLIDYPDKTNTPTAELTTIKILFNSIISTKGANFFTIDIKNFYLQHPLDRPEYLQILFYLLPDEVKKHYNLKVASSPTSTYHNT